jgi:hypothetical protein
MVYLVTEIEVPSSTLTQFNLDYFTSNSVYVGMLLKQADINPD